MTTKNNTPAPGWWAVPQNIGNDRMWAHLPEDQVLACMALHLATTGYCIAFETATITEIELSRHIVVGAASSESVVEASKHLIAAGIWTEVPGVGIDCGASEHILAKNQRIERSRKGGLAKAAKNAQDESNPFDGDDE